MEKKQLNFSAPIISARRYSSPLRSSEQDLRRDHHPIEDRNPVLTKQSDLHLGEVVRPGSIPFMWEQAPGKAKDGIESYVTSPEEAPSTPKLPVSMPFPPGKKSGELNGYRTPNMLSGELSVLRPQNRYSGELNTLKNHKLSGELNIYRQHNKLYSSLNESMGRWDSSKDGTEMNPSSESEEDVDAAFSDAMDGLTLSQHGSFSVNCSVSGISGPERPESKSSESISSDPRTRDFMINRFLPAAKAMTIEPSQYSQYTQYASRRQIVAVEPATEVKAIVPRAMTPPPSRNVCHIVPYTGQDIGSEQSEEDDDEDSFDDRSNISIKVKSCGFLPWFCSKNALRLINPLPVMKDKSRSALSSASKVSNLIKTKSWRCPSPKLPKKDSQNYQNRRVAPAFKSCELQKPKITNRPMFYSGELETRSGSPYRSSRRSSVSPSRNESPQTLYQKGVGFLPVPKNVDSYDDYRSQVSNKGSKRYEDPRRNTRSSGTRTPVPEKTLYIDSVNIPKVSHSIMNVSKTKRQVQGSTKSGPLSHVPRSGSSYQYGGRVELMKARGMSGPLAYHRAETTENRNANTCRDIVMVEDENVIQSSLTPPLPKSPSESWLSRQLPSVSPRISPRNSVSYTSLNSKISSRKQNAKTTASGAKWETIVKSSHLRQDHGCFSEELVTHVRQQPQIWK